MKGKPTRRGHLWLIPIEELIEKASHGLEDLILADGVEVVVTGILHDELHDRGVVSGGGKTVSLKVDRPGR